MDPGNPDPHPHSALPVQCSLSACRVSRNRGEPSAIGRVLPEYPENLQIPALKFEGIKQLMNRKNDESPTQRDSGNVAEFRSQGRPQDADRRVSPQSPSGNSQDQGNGQGLRQKLPPEVHAFLGHRLRSAYSDLVNEPVPGALLDLLDRLKAQEVETHDSTGAVQETSEAKEKA